jgi:hypothetical protein
MQPKTLLPVLIVSLFGAPVLAADMPYSRQQTRTIKALSDGDIAALRKGDGVGMAKAAELNGYPGPAHVLALAEQLRLTNAQQRDVRTVFERMSAAAKPLGNELIEKEQILDQLFANGEVTPDRLSSATMAIAELQGRLRAVHLAAHLETRALLDPDQIARYQQLRGYGDPGSPAHPHHHRG